MEATAFRKEEGSKRLNPQLFALWVGMASMVMLFGAFTSAYIVKQGAGNWLQFSLPFSFYISTLTIIASSFTLHLGYNAFKSLQSDKYKTMLLVSTMLAFVFMVLQYQGWMEMYANGVDMRANVGGSFFYLITGAHAAHVLGGITVLLVTCIYAFTLPMKFSEVRRNKIEMVLHFWHFLGALWIYLFVFLNVIR
ncbi:MAG: cytochrome c oxidase subunit 3 [Saprospiraceae bacterium]|nr:cytochrome c oxidase subunit 3 [Saprospiraceae bacterium]